MPTTTGKATDFITFSRASNATVTDADGKIKWAPHNLVLNSAAPVTQSITVISGAQYTVNMTGSGSVALSGAGSGTVTTGNPVTVTASTTTLTLTVSGTVSTMWAYRSDLGGMQLNGAGTTYNATTAAAYYGPRRDFDPVTLACKGLLVEEQRTNLFLNSAAFNSWSPSNATVDANVSTTTAPDGTTTADRIVATNSSGYVYSQIAVTSGTAYTYSVHLKADNLRYVSLVFAGSGWTGGNFANFDLQTGAVVSADSGITAHTPIALGNGWYRVAATKTAASSATADFRIQVSPSAWVSGTADKWFSYGAQLEAGSFATSYIPTGSATATRSADVSSVSTQAFPYSSTEGTLVANVLSPNGQSSNRRIWSINDDANGTTNSLELRNNSTNVSILTIAGATTGTVTSTWPDTAFKIGAAWAASDYALGVNGGTVATGSSGTIPTGATTLRLGNFTTTQSRWLCGHIRQITYLPRRISNAELQTRTA